MEVLPKLSPSLWIGIVRASSSSEVHPCLLEGEALALPLSKLRIEDSSGKGEPSSTKEGFQFGT